MGLTLNPDLLQICEYISSSYKNVEIWIATNECQTKNVTILETISKI